MKMDPQTQHHWLRQFEGEWTCRSEAVTAAGKDEACWTGRETVRALGELWTLFEGDGDEFEGVRPRTLMTLGFDPSRGEGGRFVGCWVGSMMATLWIYEGTLDESAQVLTLETEGPDCKSGGRIARYRDVVALHGPDERTLSSFMQDADGNWIPVMRMRYLRANAER